MERSKVVDCLIVVSKFLIGSTDSIMALIHFYTQGGVAVSSQHVAGLPQPGGCKSHPRWLPLCPSSAWLPRAGQGRARCIGTMHKLQLAALIWDIES